MGVVYKIVLRAEPGPSPKSFNLCFNNRLEKSYIFDTVMDIKLFPSLQPYFTSRLSDVTTDREEYAQIENFLLDERPIDAVRALYRTYLD